MKEQARVLTLERDEHNATTLYRLEKDWTLRFVRGPSLMGVDVRLFVNNTPDRKLYNELHWQLSGANKRDKSGAFAELHCTFAGPFHYFFVCDNNESIKQAADAQKIDGDGYFQVAPTLTIYDNIQLPLDCIQSQTYLTKLLGPLDEWLERLALARECGYNMVHLTPIQLLGESNSSYSIADQLAINTSLGKCVTYDDVHKVTDVLRKEWGILSVGDVVWNHTAKSSVWLKDHPECGYTLVNSPHLRPAFVLDRALIYFAKRVEQNEFAPSGLPSIIETEEHLNALRHALNHILLPPLQLHEYFVVDVEKYCKEFQERLQNPGSPSKRAPCKKSVTIEYHNYRRFGATVDIELATQQFVCGDDNYRLNAFRHHLDYLNGQAQKQCAELLAQAIDALIGHVRYERVAAHGHLVRDYIIQHPLFPSYFTCPSPTGTWQGDETSMDDPKWAMHIMAFNGWVMGDDPLRNFAEPGSTVYFRRALVCWGDCIKLRYGNEPSDCPYLWQRMTEYTQQCARVFDGLRLDNSHSTPIHVAEYLLARAREVRPELYVVAELFTGGEDIDNIFVNRLGITSLIREAQSAHDSHEEGRLVYKYGGDVVGAFLQPHQRQLIPTTAHALFMDITHDNQCPVQTRSVIDLLPSAALVSMASCASGSSRGYDELVDYHVHVVKESRLYRKLATKGQDCHVESGYVHPHEAIIQGKRVLNKLHFMLGMHGYSQVFVDQKTYDTVAVTRHNPITHNTVVLVARTAFNKHNIADTPEGVVIEIGGEMTEVILEMRMTVDESKKHDNDSKFINGLTQYSCEVNENLPPSKSNILHLDGRHVHFPGLLPGCVVAFRVRMPEEVRQSINTLRARLCEFGFAMPDLEDREIPLTDAAKSKLADICERMSLADYNRLLYRCNDEERAEGNGGSAYHVPNWRSLLYCGLMGIIPPMDDIRASNDLGHPLCGNIRAGDWLADYTINRLLLHSGTKALGEWFRTVFEPYRGIPHYLKPLYFDAIINGAYQVIRKAMLSKMPPFVASGNDFTQALAESSLCFVGECKTAALPKLADTVLQATKVPEVSISAGLPHFSHGLFRNWGRDTFIALHGCLLSTGRLEEARNIILAYAGALRHGLIPNLCGGGTHGRYNCRDAVWFWMHAIVKCCRQAKNYDLLNMDVLRAYPTDESEAYQENKVEPLHATMYEALSKHYAGIDFRERNAGPGIDEHMTHEGFHVTAYVDHNTGLVFGGNKWNCGTWMDKMGSSDVAGNKGQPATPRDGAAVELQGLCAETLDFLVEAHKARAFPLASVKDTNGTECTWQQWRDKLYANFERHFYVPIEGELVPTTNPLQHLVNKRGILKDSYGSSNQYTDYQLRPNFAIALSVAPSLVSSEAAWTALNAAQKHLLGPLGIRTLDPDDWAYNGDYNNDDNSHNKVTARGWNYHQGPEWLWVLGYYLKARLAVAVHSKREDWSKSASRECEAVLAQHNVHIHRDHWRSLPELTNKNGSPCAHSCAAQAWSVGCILEVLDDLRHLDE